MESEAQFHFIQKIICSLLNKIMKRALCVCVCVSWWDSDDIYFKRKKKKSTNSFFYGSRCLLEWDLIVEILAADVDPGGVGEVMLSLPLETKF